MSSRYTLFPIQYPNLFSYYEKQRDAFWVPKEIDLEQDVKEWNEKLTPEDKHFLTHTLAFFAQADGIVAENVLQNFGVEVDFPEATVFYGIQAGIEAIHWEMYSILIDTLISDPEAKAKALDAIENYPCIKKKADWMLKWSNTKDSPITQRLIAFACAEGIFFSSAFASIFYYKKRGLMPGLCLSNTFISRDEGLHRDFGCELFSVLSREDPLDPEIVYAIVDDAVQIECEFVAESLNVDLIGISVKNMQDYVKFTADHLLARLGLNKKYNVTNPFGWMELISLTNKTNFFERRVSEYQKVSSDQNFEIPDDF